MAELILGEVNAISAAEITAEGVRITGAESSVNSSSGLVTQVVRVTDAESSASCTSELLAQGMRISYAAMDVSSEASVSVLAIRIQPAASVLISVANIATNSRLIKYVKAGLSGAATTKTNAHKYKTISGALLAQASVEAYHGERDVKGEMHDYLPRYYDEFAEVETLVKAGANESTRLRAKLSEMLDQFYVESATYGLGRWRGLAGIDDSAARSDVAQRGFINAKLRGVGTVTHTHLKSVVDAFYESEIYDESSDYKVRMKFVNKRGRPANIEDIKQAVDSVIPAHLEPYFEFGYLPWSELDIIKREWAEVDDYTFVTAEDFEWRTLEGVGLPWAQLDAVTAQELGESFDLNGGGNIH